MNQLPESWAVKCPEKDDKGLFKKAVLPYINEHKYNPDVPFKGDRVGEWYGYDNNCYKLWDDPPENVKRLTPEQFILLKEDIEIKCGKQFQLIQEYPGSPPEGTIACEDDGKFFIRDGDKRIEVLNTHILDFPEFWREREVVENMELRFKTNLGNKVFRSEKTIMGKNGYRFLFPSGNKIDMIFDPGEYEITF